MGNETYWALRRRELAKKGEVAEPAKPKRSKKEKAVDDQIAEAEAPAEIVEESQEEPIEDESESAADEVSDAPEGEAAVE